MPDSISVSEWRWPVSDEKAQRCPRRAVLRAVLGARALEKVLLIEAASIPTRRITRWDRVAHRFG
jgi:hypothetical protein